MYLEPTTMAVEAGTPMYLEPTTGLEMKTLRFAVDQASKSSQPGDH